MLSPGILRRGFALHVVRPYIRHELPAWGRVYNLFVGGYRTDADWAAAKPRWVRGKLHGYDMLVDLSRWSPRKTFFLGRFYDLGTQSVVRALLREGDTFVDIGANLGMISLVAARQVGAAGRVIAFEPNPGPRASFQAAIDRNRLEMIDLRAMGLADSEDELVLSVPKVNHGEGSFGRTHYDAGAFDAIRCPVRVGDSELAGVDPRLVKIDVEGFETNVLRGLPQLLARSRPFIATEVVSNHLKRAGSSVAEFASILTDAGYAPWAMTLVRKGLRHRLKLVPATLGEKYSGDVLWVHADRADDPALARAMQ